MDSQSLAPSFSLLPHCNGGGGAYSIFFPPTVPEMRSKSMPPPGHFHLGPRAHAVLGLQAF
jgi:hypothetical protein